MATKKDAALTAANQLINLTKQVQSLRQQLNDFVYQYNTQSWSTVWAAMATAALGADGALGAADGSPVVTNPIDNRVTNQTALAKAVSKNQLVAGVVLLQQLQNFLTNAAVSQGNYNQNVDDLAT